MPAEQPTQPAPIVPQPVIKKSISEHPLVPTVVGGIFTILATVLTIILPGIVNQRQESDSQTSSSSAISSNATSVASSAANTAASLRLIAMSEFGRNINSVPDNIYAYASIENMKKSFNSSFIEVDNNRSEKDFEIQKESGKLYLVGYQKESDFTKITLELDLTNVRVDSFSYPVKIPFETISGVNDETEKKDRYATLRIRLSSAQVSGSVTTH